MTERNEGARLRDIRCFILDMDGTIYLGEQLFDCTKPFLRLLEARGLNYVFFTNNSSRNAGFYREKLARMEIDVPAERMITANMVAMEYLKRHHPDQGVFLLGTPYLREDFIRVGIRLEEERPDVVVIGFDTTLHYDRLERACTFVRNGLPYYGINPDFNCPAENGRQLPDCGSIARLIEASTGRLPLFFGKPSSLALEYILQYTGVKAEEAAMVGDRLYTDIRLGEGTPLCRILVLSGETRREDLAGQDVCPDIVAEDLAQLANWLETT